MHGTGWQYALIKRSSYGGGEYVGLAYNISVRIGI
jgi:hypothetical protein